MNTQSQPANAVVTEVVPQGVEPMVIDTPGGQVSLDFGDRRQASPVVEGNAIPPEQGQPLATPQPFIPQGQSVQQPVQQQQAQPITTGQQPVQGQQATPVQQMDSQQQYMMLLGQQVQQGQQAIQQLQQMAGRIPQIEQVIAAARTGDQTKVESEMAKLNQQITEHFGDSAPLVNEMIEKKAALIVDSRLGPIQQQQQQLLAQQIEVARADECRNAMSELEGIGIPKEASIPFIEHIRTHQGTQGIDPVQFGHVVRSMAFKYLVPQMMQQRAAQPTQQVVATQAAQTAGVSPTIPQVPSQVRAADAAKVQGQLVTGSGSVPSTQGTQTLEDIDTALLRQSWAMGGQRW